MLFVWINPGLHGEDLAHINFQLTFFVKRELKTVHRPWCRPFEVITSLKIAAAVTRAFVLVLRPGPAWGAAEVGTFGKDGVQPNGFAYNPHPEFLGVFFAHLTDRVGTRKSCFEFRGRQEQHPRKS